MRGLPLLLVVLLVIGPNYVASIVQTKDPEVVTDVALKSPRMQWDNSFEGQFWIFKKDRPYTGRPMIISPDYDSITKGAIHTALGNGIFSPLNSTHFFGFHQSFGDINLNYYYRSCGVGETCTLPAKSCGYLGSSLLEPIWLGQKENVIYGKAGRSEMFYVDCGIGRENNSVNMALSGSDPLFGMAINDTPYGLYKRSSSGNIFVAKFPKISVSGSRQEFLLDFASTETITSGIVHETDTGLRVFIGTATKIIQFDCEPGCGTTAIFAQGADAFLLKNDRLLAFLGTKLYFLFLADDCSTELTSCKSSECFQPSTSGKSRKTCVLCREISTDGSRDVASYTDTCLADVLCDRSSSIWINKEEANRLSDAPTCPTLNYSPQIVLLSGPEKKTEVTINISGDVSCSYEDRVVQKFKKNNSTDCVIRNHNGFNSLQAIKLEVTDEENPGSSYFLPIQFVNCELLTSCELCLQTNSGCKWNIESSQCFGVSSSITGADVRTLQGDCPSFRLTTVGGVNKVSDQEGSILSGTIQTVHLALDRPIRNIDVQYACSNGPLKFDPSVNNTLSCKVNPIDVKGANTVTEVYTILWRATSNPLVNGSLGTLQLHLYTCTGRTTCRQCTFGQNMKTGCSWCPTAPNICAATHQSCSSSDQERLCTLDITNSLPYAVPITTATTGFDKVVHYVVNGSYLANDLGSIQESITFDGVICPIINASTRLGDLENQTIVCRVPTSLVPKSFRVSVVIDQATWTSNSTFSYFDYQLVELSKDIGPQWGHTALEIEANGLAHIKKIDKDSTILFDKDGDRVLLNCNNTPYNEGVTVLSCATGNTNLTGQFLLTLSWTLEDARSTPMKIDHQNHELTFTYTGNPYITEITPQQGYLSGGRHIFMTGMNFLSVSSIKLQLSNAGTSKSIDCTASLDTLVTCLSPRFVDRTTNDTVDPNQNVSAAGRLRLRREVLIPIEWTMEVLMDGVQLSNKPESRGSFGAPFKVYPDPYFNASMNQLDYTSQSLTIHGVNLNLAATRDNYTVILGEKTPCIVSGITETVIVCDPPSYDKLEQFEDQTLDVKVSLYGLDYRAGTIKISKVESAAAIPLEYWLPATVGGVLVLVLTLVGACYGCRKAFKYRREFHAMLKRFDQLEVNVRNECRQAFAELQTKMTDLNVDEVGIPFWDFKNYTTKVLFPSRDNHTSLNKYQHKTRSPVVMKALTKFENMLYNQEFLVTFIHTLEDQSNFTSSDKVEVAALLMMILQSKMDYATSVLKELLQDLIQLTIKKKYPKLLLRRSESVVEKLLAHWIAISLYQYLQDFAGKPLFLLVSAIKQQVEKGPVDMLTHEARYSLSEDRLLREEIEFTEVVVRVITENNTDKAVQCTVLTCDSISQMKDKVMDVLYRNTPFEQRPKAQDYCLEWYPNDTVVPLADEDPTSRTESGWRRINTVGHYNITDQSLVKLTMRMASLNTQTTKLKKSYENIQYKGSTSTLHFNTGPDVVNTQVKKWHLTKHTSDNVYENQNVMMRELFLNRLIVTKGILHSYVDDLFKAILSVEQLPPTIKWLFDFMDEQAHHHNLSSDQEMTHTWKNNSLHLRFWVNIIKNPNFVFDIHKNQIVDSSLTVVASTLIDSCATSEPMFGKVRDAPVNKLLFAKNRPEYREMVYKYYSDIRDKPAVKDEELKAYLSAISKKSSKEFQKTQVLKDLYWYAENYSDQILKSLAGNPKLCFEFGSLMEMTPQRKATEYVEADVVDVHGDVRDTFCLTW